MTCSFLVLQQKGGGNNVSPAPVRASVRPSGSSGRRIQTANDEKDDYNLLVDYLAAKARDNAFWDEELRPEDPARPQRIRLPDKARGMGIFCCATRGTGKSRMLGRLIAWQDFRRDLAGRP